MRKHFLYLVILLLAVSNSFAQLKWEQVVLPGISSRTVRVTTSPRNIIFAVTSGSKKLYRSFNEGATWDSIQTPFSAFITTIDSNGNLLRMNKDTLSVSMDNGFTWTTHKLPYGSTQFLFSYRDTLFLLTYGSYGPQVYRSIDSGASWNNGEVFSNGSDFNWAGAAIAPNGNIFGFLQFDNSVHLIHGNGPTRIGTEYGPLVMDNNPMRWMMFDNAGYGYGLHTFLLRSFDYGIHWHPIDSFSSEGLHTYLGPYGVSSSNDIICVTDTETVISFDHADSWSRIGDGAPTSYYKKYVTSSKGTVFYMSDSGTYRSTFFTSTPKTAQAENNFNTRYDRLRDVIVVNKTIGHINPDYISLYDVTGRNIRTNHIDLRENKVEIDAQGLQTGVYLIRYVTPSEEHSAKILITK